MSLDELLQRALATRLNLQISTSGLPFMEEWMDNHVDRWLDHVPAPPDMPDGHGVRYELGIGSDLQRIVYSAWGDPRGFIPRLSDYFKLCHISKNDALALDQLGGELEPKLVGSWLGIWGKTVITGWLFRDPIAWATLEPHFGTHEAKFLVKQWMERSGANHVERFSQAIGEHAFTDLEIPIPDAAPATQVGQLRDAFAHFGAAPIPQPLLDAWSDTGLHQFAMNVRIRNGKISRIGALGPAIDAQVFTDLSTRIGLPVAEKLDRTILSLNKSGVDRIEYATVGEWKGIDVIVEPGDPAPNPAKAAAVSKSETPLSN